MYVTKGQVGFSGFGSPAHDFWEIFFHIANDALTAFVSNYNGPNIYKDTKP
jgi:hypothetical protein